MDKIIKSIIRERIETYGINSLSDEESLSFLTGIPVSVIKPALDNSSLPELIRYADTLQLTSVQKTKLELIYSLSKRLHSSPYKQKQSLDSSTKSGDYFVQELQFLSSEVFAIALLNSKNQLIKTEIISHGTINEAAVYPREVVKLALRYNASAVILAHNHPGGSASPSSADICITKKLQTALQSISIRVIDHVIVYDGKFTSFAEKGLLD